MLYDEDIPKVIPADFGIGVVFKNKSGKFVSVGPEDNIRRVTLSIHSWVGTSPGAIHYYCRLKVWGLSFKCLETNCKDSYIKVSERYDIGGAFKKPNSMECFDIECERKLTKKEIDKNPERWNTEYDKPGSLTGCFMTEQQAFLYQDYTFRAWR